MIGTAGCPSRMRPAMSAPLPSGRWESITTTSGWRSIANRTASPVVAAVPAILRSPVALIMAASASETSRWASTGQTGIAVRSGGIRNPLPGIRDPVLHGAALAGSRADAKPPARHLGSLAHGDQSEVTRRGSVATVVESNAVVDDPGQDAVVHSRHCTFDATGLRMLADVGQRLLGDPVGNHLGLGRRAALQRRFQRDLDIGLLFHRVEVLSQRRRQPAFIQRRGPQLE